MAYLFPTESRAEGESFFQTFSTAASLKCMPMLARALLTIEQALSVSLVAAFRVGWNP
jgi:hypothetical protein